MDEITIKLSLEDRGVEQLIENYLEAKRELIAALSHEKIEISENEG